MDKTLTYGTKKKYPQLQNAKQFRSNKISELKI